jgi:hypothetical protein
MRSEQQLAQEEQQLEQQLEQQPAQQRTNCCRQRIEWLNACLDPHKHKIAIVCFLISTGCMSQGELKEFAKILGLLTSGMSLIIVSQPNVQSFLSRITGIRNPDINYYGSLSCTGVVAFPTVGSIIDNSPSLQKSLIEMLAGATVFPVGLCLGYRLCPPNQNPNSPNGSQLAPEGQLEQGIEAATMSR